MILCQFWFNHSLFKFKFQVFLLQYIIRVFFVLPTNLTAFSGTSVLFAIFFKISSKIIHQLSA